MIWCDLFWFYQIQNHLVKSYLCTLACLFFSSFRFVLFCYLLFTGVHQQQKVSLLWRIKFFWIKLSWTQLLLCWFGPQSKLPLSQSRRAHRLRSTYYSQQVVNMWILTACLRHRVSSKRTSDVIIKSKYIQNSSRIVQHSCCTATSLRMPVLPAKNDPFAIHGKRTFPCNHACTTRSPKTCAGRML